MGTWVIELREEITNLAWVMLSCSALKHSGRDGEEAYQRGSLAWRYRLGSLGKNGHYQTPRVDETTEGKYRARSTSGFESVETLTLKGLLRYTVMNWETKALLGLA